MLRTVSYCPHSDTNLACRESSFMASEVCLTICAKKAYEAHLSEVDFTTDEIKLTYARMASAVFAWAMGMLELFYKFTRCQRLTCLLLEHNCNGGEP
jgi:hypothetical protein